jgi:hypothetical protein
VNEHGILQRKRTGRLDGDALHTAHRAADASGDWGFLPLRICEAPAGRAGSDRRSPSGSRACGRLCQERFEGVITRLAGFFGCLVMTFGTGCIVRAETAEPRWVYAGPTLNAEFGGSLSYEFVDVANVRQLKGKVTYWGRKYSGLQLDPIADADPRERARAVRFHAAIASGRLPPSIDTALTARILEDALDKAGLPEIETYTLIDCRSDRSRTAETVTYFNGARRESHYSESEHPWRPIPPMSTLAAIEHIVCKRGVAK